MIHEMKLGEKAFVRMKNGEKLVEYRLNDEKRKLIKRGDAIVFLKLPLLMEKLFMEVTGLESFLCFRDAFLKYRDLPGSDTGDDIEKDVAAMYQYYKSKDEEKEGVVALHLRKLTLVEVITDYLFSNFVTNEALIEKLKKLMELGMIEEKYLSNFESMVQEIDEIAKKGNGIVSFATIQELLLQCEAYQNMAESLTPFEVMEIATKKLGRELPLTDADLEKVVEAAIISDIPENVWRIALNYDLRIKDKSKLEDYIIRKQNAWYIVEFITSEFTGIHLEKLVDGLINTVDLPEIIHLACHFQYCNNSSKYQKFIFKLEDTIRKLDGWTLYQETLKH